MHKYLKVPGVSVMQITIAGGGGAEGKIGGGGIGKQKLHQNRMKCLKSHPLLS